MLEGFSIFGCVMLAVLIVCFTSGVVIVILDALFFRSDQTNRYPLSEKSQKVLTFFICFIVIILISISTALWR